MHSYFSEDFPVLSGKYFGETPPGNEPVVLGERFLYPGSFGSFCTAFSPDHTKFIFVHYESHDQVPAQLMITEQVDGIWAKPEPLPFNSTEVDNDMCWSYDGSKLIWRSGRALPGDSKPPGHTRLWQVDHDGSAWGEPAPLLCGGEVVRTGFPSISRNDTLFFLYGIDGVEGIYSSKKVDGVYQTPTLESQVFHDRMLLGDLYVSPEEDFLIISCIDPEGKLTNPELDLFLLYKQKDGSWSEPINLGPQINTKGGGENCPWLSWDGKFFFFHRYDPEKKVGRIYWMKADFLKELINTN